jgi:hypothetical protein
VPVVRLANVTVKPSFTASVTAAGAWHTEHVFSTTAVAFGR